MHHDIPDSALGLAAIKKWAMVTKSFQTVGVSIDTAKLQRQIEELSAKLESTQMRAVSENRKTVQFERHVLDSAECTSSEGTGGAHKADRESTRMGVRNLGTVVNIQVLGDIRREHLPRPPWNGRVLNNEAGRHDTGTNNNNNSKVAGTAETRSGVSRTCVLYQSVAGIAATSLDACLVCVRQSQLPVTTVLSQVIMFQIVGRDFSNDG